MGLIWLNLAVPGREVWAQDDPAMMYFAAVAGSVNEGKVPVLLRWYAAEGQLPSLEFSLYRKEGTADSTSPLQLLSTTSRLRNVALIRAILEQAELKIAYDDLINNLSSMLDEPVTPDTYVEQLLRILDGTEECGSCAMRRNLLVQSNYAVAIVEGLGYLDLAEPKTYTYELRASTTQGQDDLVVGRVTVDASKPNKLPAPSQPTELELPGERGHLIVFLRWEEGPLLKPRSDEMFGYNVYRGPADANDTFENLLMQGKLQKLNRLPILPPSAQARGSSPEENYMFVDDNLTMSKTGPVGIPFLGGEQFRYWVTARDLLGQDGQPSESAAVTVEDKSGPAIPSGLRTDLVNTNGTERIGLVWNRNTDDTVTYRVYRYQEYEHVQKPGPFPPVGGMTEGYISDVAQPGTDNPVFLDNTVKLPEHENSAFWYCVAAVDAAGNQSPISPPVRGIVFDNVPPPPPSEPELCSYYSSCVLEDWITTDTTQASGNLIDVIFYLNKHSTNISAVEIERKSMLNGIGDYALVYRGQFTGGDTLNFHETLSFETIVHSSTDPLCCKDSDSDSSPKIPSHTYRVSLFDVSGFKCGTYDMPGVLYELLNTHAYNVIFSVVMGGEYNEQCPRTDIVEHNPDDNGKPRSLRFRFPKSDDAAGVILYRSTNCSDFFPVSETRFSGQAYLDTLDDFRPDQGAEVCYAAQTFDENNNRSPMRYLGKRIRFPSRNVSKIVPSMQSAEPVGEADLPKARLSWFGPTTGVSGFWVYFGTTQELSGQETAVFLSQNEYQFNPKDNIYQAILDITADQSKERIAINKTYIIRVKALMQNGEERFSNNTVAFNWAVNPRLETHPIWPIRSLPAQTPGLIAQWLPPAEGGDFNSPFTYGVGLVIGGVPPLGEGIGIFIEFPFTVYRRRVDIPGSYVQVSPLLKQENPNRDVQDPFFLYGYEELPGEVFIPRVYYLDTVNLINGATYEYKIVRMSEGSGELVEEIGPSNPVRVFEQ